MALTDIPRSALGCADTRDPAKYRHLTLKVSSPESQRVFVYAHEAISSKRFTHSAERFSFDETFGILVRPAILFGEQTGLFFGQNLHVASINLIHTGITAKSGPTPAADFRNVLCTCVSAAP